MTFRKTTSVNVDNAFPPAIEWAELNGHKECIKCKAPEISKSELGKVLKAGQEVPGAVLVEGISVGVSDGTLTFTTMSGPSPQSQEGDQRWAAERKDRYQPYVAHQEADGAIRPMWQWLEIHH